MKIDENILYRQRNSSLLLNDLRKFNETFRKGVPHDNIKNHKKPVFTLSLEDTFFTKPQGEESN